MALRAVCQNTREVLASASHPYPLTELDWLQTALMRSLRARLPRMQRQAFRDWCAANDIAIATVAPAQQRVQAQIPASWPRKLGGSHANRS